MVVQPPKPTFVRSCFSDIHALDKWNHVRRILKGKREALDNRAKGQYGQVI